MKNAILATLVSLTFVNCTWHKPNNEPITLTFGTPEDNFRSKVSGTWTSCESRNGKYILYILNTANENDITLNARVYELPDCKGDKYESYKLAKLSSKIKKIESATGGLAALTYNIYYPISNPDHKVIEDGYTRIDDRVILSADGVLAVSDNELMMTLENLVSLSSTTVEKTKTIVHKFVRQSVDIEEMYLNIKTHYSFEEAELVSVNSSAEAQNYLLENTKTLVDPNCINEYFKHQEHLELTSAGLSIDYIQFRTATDRFHRQFIVIKLYYDVGNEGSSLSCLNLLRPAGIALQQK